jgi:hypothetical protein
MAFEGPSSMAVGGQELHDENPAERSWTSTVVRRR